MRFSNHEIFYEIDKVILKIKEELMKINLESQQ